MRGVTLNLRPILVGVLVASLPWVVAAPAFGDGDEKSPPSAPTIPRPPAVDSQAELQDLYRDLYDIQLELGRSSQGSNADLDSMRTLRAELLSEIRRLSREVERRSSERDSRPPRPAFPEIREIEGFFEELESSGGEFDWQLMSEFLERNAESFGEGLAIIGEELRDLQVDVNEDRIRINTGSGSRFTFTIPPEVKEELSEGLRQMGLELSRVLDDSSRARYGAEIEGLLQELPEDVGSRFFGRHRRNEKKVIDESVFRFKQDFEVAENELVRGDILLIGCDGYVEGEIEGSVYVLFGDLFIEGEGRVEQDAFSFGGRVQVDDDSEVHGRRFDASSMLPGLGIGSWGASGSMPWLLHWVRVAILALLVVAGFVVANTRMSVMIEHGEAGWGKDLASGVLWFAISLGVFVVALVGLVLAVLGAPVLIPVVLLVVIAFSLVILASYAVGCHVVGRRLLDRFGVETLIKPWHAALVGLAILEIPPLLALAVGAEGSGSPAGITLRSIDILLRFVVLALGFGAFVATRAGADRPIDAATFDATEVKIPSLPGGQG